MSGDTQQVMIYRVLVVSVPLMVVAFCVGAAITGNEQFSDRSYFFRDITDAGHPGAAVVLGSMGFGAAAVLCALLAFKVAVRRAMVGWLMLGLLLAVMSLDNLSRFHSVLQYGATISRLVYLAVGLAALFCIASAQQRGTPRVVGLIAGLLMGVSEGFDHWTHRLIPYSNTYQLATVLEESAGSLAAWFAVLALLSEVTGVGWNADRAAS